ncbi:MAG: CRISPR-associated endoribonuclease Cas6, partial [Candidatus Bathyarchaeia archaeon]
MRITLRLCDHDSYFVSLPQHYNHLVQAAIYRSISPSLSLFLHEKGFTYGKRAFKMFTFSRLLGKNRREGETLLFEGEIALHLSSPIERFIKDIANTMVRHGLFKIGTKELSVVELKFHKEPKIAGEMRIKTLSPITIYSTLFTQNCKK